MRLRAENIEKRFPRSRNGASHFYAVNKTYIALEPGKVACLLGRSGSGKTTLLNLLSGLVTPTGGKVWADETDLYSLNDKALSRFRLEHFAVIPQGASGIGALNVLENILLPASMKGMAAEEEKARLLMETLGILELEKAYPNELSGGECKRMAIARALMTKADVLFADEPTADLDEENTHLALKLLREEAQRGAAVLLVTHETDAAQYADQVYRMDAGTLRMARE